MDGGWLVTLYGSSFSEVKAPVCRIGSHIADAQHVLGGLACSVGALSRSGVVSLELSGNGVQFSAVGSLLVVPSSKMLRLEPSYGSLSGGTNVFISGDEGFSLLSGLWCRFCVSVVVAAKMDDGSDSVNVVTCYSPVQHHPIRCSVEISSDRQRWLHAGWFEYRNVIRLHTINPSVGTVSGGTAVSIIANEIRAGDSVICRFGSVQAAPVVSESGHCVCVTPAVNESRVVDVALSLNGQEWSVGTALYRYLNPIELLWVEPPTVISGRRQSIHLKVRNLFGWKSAVFCSFADQESVPGVVLTENVVECSFHLSTVGGNVSVSVSVKLCRLEQCCFIACLVCSHCSDAVSLNNIFQHIWLS
jgi:hypothetical protein